MSIVVELPSQAEVLAGRTLHNSPGTLVPGVLARAGSSVVPGRIASSGKRAGGTECG